jgi:hypothetical protein
MAWLQPNWMAYRSGLARYAGIRVIHDTGAQGISIWQKTTDAPNKAGARS